MAPRAAAATRPADLGTFQVIPLALIDFSKTNPRKSYDKGRLDELAESIRSKGLIEAIVVRPKGKRFELIVGERRTRAAKLAGLEGIKSEIRDLGDEEVLELQVIENLQRDDVHPLDEADGYRSLMAMNPEKHTPEHLAAQIGKDVSYVYRRIRMLTLIGQLQKKFRAGELGPAHAVELARLQPADQGRALEELWRFRGDVGPTVGEVKRFIDREVLLDLKKAPFDTTSAELVPAAGACLSCPKRTGCAPALFDDIKNGDTCTDPTCFKAKTAAALALKTAALEEKHGADGVVRIVTDYTSGNENKDLRKRWPGVLIRGEFKFASKGACDYVRPGLIVMGDRGDGATGDVRLVCTSPKTCRVHRERFDSSRGITVNASQRARDRRLRHEQRVWPLAKGAVLDAVLAKVKVIGLEDLRLLAAAAFDRAHYDGQKQIVPLMGWDLKVWNKDRRFAAKQIAELKQPQLLRLLYAAALGDELAAPSLNYGGAKKTPDLDHLAKRYKVPAAAIERKVRASMPLKPAPKKKAAAK